MNEVHMNYKLIKIDRNGIITFSRNFKKYDNALNEFVKLVKENENERDNLYKDEKIIFRIIDKNGKVMLENVFNGQKIRGKNNGEIEWF